MPEPSKTELKPKCPECGTELIPVDNKLPDECPKCKFILDGFEEFKRWFKAARKAEEAEKPIPVQPTKRTPFSSLRRRK